jgi:hypothetical protein
MDDNLTPPPNYFSLTLTTWVLALAGWGGLVWLLTAPLDATGDLYHPIPGLGPRWLFFVCWLAALTGTSLPFVRYLHHRFARLLPPPSVMLRQAIWVGLFGATCAWLQIGHIFSLALAALVAAGLGGVEWFLRMRERARWNPEAPDEPA